MLGSTKPWHCIVGYAVGCELLPFSALAKTAPKHDARHCEKQYRALHCALKGFPWLFKPT